MSAAGEAGGRAGPGRRGGEGSSGGGGAGPCGGGGSGRGAERGRGWGGKGSEAKRSEEFELKSLNLKYLIFTIFLSVSSNPTVYF